jgi:hypothetical protein
MNAKASINCCSNKDKKCAHPANHHDTLVVDGKPVSAGQCRKRGCACDGFKASPPPKKAEAAAAK